MAVFDRTSPRVVELACGIGVAVNTLLVVALFLPHALSTSGANLAAEAVLAAILLAAGAVVAFASYQDAFAGDRSWLRAAGASALFFVVLVVAAQASIGHLLLPAAALTLLALLVARWRVRPAVG